VLDERMKKNAIFTACDAKYGDFLIDHWLKSLRENVDLTDLEPVVLDYGLNTEQRLSLERHAARVVPCRRDGHVVNLRFRDMAAVLAQTPYKQAVLSDGGDIVFQADFTPAFRNHPDKFRGVTEDLRPSFGMYITDEFFAKEDRKHLQKVLRDRPMINAGFIFGPGASMRALGEEMMRRLKCAEKFGPDQVLVNDIFYRDGFHALDRTFNYVIATSTADLAVRGGLFYADEELIHVVHNSGNLSFLRPVEDFGYGPGHNHLKKELMMTLRALYSATDGVIESRAELHRFVDTLRKDLTKGYETSVDQMESALKRFRDTMRK